MMLGYIVVRALLPLVNLLSRLPNRVGRAFARVLNAATAPFDVVNYWGSCAGSRFYRPAPRMARKFDAVIAAEARL
jgi:hypothetical protein